MKNLLKWPFGLLIVAYLAVTIVHLSNGIGFGRSLAGGVIDARVAVTCPSNTGLLWDIVNRDALQDFGLRAVFAFGGSYSDLCEFGLDSTFGS
jgi:hypothetical protein